MSVWHLISEVRSLFVILGSLGEMLQKILFMQILRLIPDKMKISVLMKMTNLSSWPDILECIEQNQILTLHPK